MSSARVAMFLLGALAIISVILKLVLLCHVRGSWGYFMLPTHMEGLALGSMMALIVRDPALDRMLVIATKYLWLVLVLIVAIAVYFHGLRNDNPQVVLVSVPLLSF